MKKKRAVSLALRFFIAVCIFAFLGVIGIEAADKTSSENSENQADEVPPAPSRELESTYLIDFLSPPNAGDKTLYIKKSQDGKISATWECTEHGFQKLTNASFDGEILTFNALSGTPGDEYFYFHLESYGSFLIGYAKTKKGHKSPVVAKSIE
jgi:hypothetical protein